MSESTAKKKSLKDSLPMILAVLGYVIQANVPRTLNGSPILSLFLKLLLCAPMIAYAWRPADSTPMPQKIFLSGAVLLSAAAAVFLRDQISLLVQVIFAAALLVLMLAVPGKDAAPMNARTLLLFLILIGRKSNYAFLREGMPPFLLPALLLGVLLAFLIAIRFPMKEAVLAGKLLMLGFLALFCTMEIWIGILHLNYALDFTPPQEYQVEIEDKKITRRRKSADDYQFEVTADGKSFWIDVSSGEYDEYEIGDTYPIRRYAGAFGKAFFISGNMDS